MQNFLLFHKYSYILYLYIFIIFIILHYNKSLKNLSILLTIKFSRFQNKAIYLKKYGNL